MARVTSSAVSSQSQIRFIVPINKKEAKERQTDPPTDRQTGSQSEISFKLPRNVSACGSFPHFHKESIELEKHFLQNKYKEFQRKKNQEGKESRKNHGRDHKSVVETITQKQTTTTKKNIFKERPNRKNRKEFSAKERAKEREKKNC